MTAPAELIVLFARTRDLRGISEGFNSRSFNDNAFEALIVTGVLVAICVMLLLIGRYARRYENLKSYDSPSELFRELCRAHGLDWRSRRLLRRLAATCELASPALIFVEPERFNVERLPSEWQAEADRIDRLRRMLFDAP
jgi:hypothetical protein